MTTSPTIAELDDEHFQAQATETEAANIGAEGAPLTEVWNRLDVWPQHVDLAKQAWAEGREDFLADQAFDAAQAAR